MAVRRDSDVGSHVVVVVMLRCHYYWVERERLVTSNHPENTDGDNSPAVTRVNLRTTEAEHTRPGQKDPTAGGSIGRDETQMANGENLKPVTG